MEDHHRRYHISRHRRATTAGAEQISEHLIVEQIAAVISEKRVHRVVHHQMAAQTSRVQQLDVRIALALHAPVLFDPHENREHQRANSSTAF